MAIQLYKKGTTHTVGGIECEVCNFNPSELESKLKEGWVTSPGELSNDAQNEEIERNDEENAQEETGENEEKDAEKTLNPVRIAARDAGIDGWEIKRIKTLEALLNEQKD